MNGIVQTSDMIWIEETNQNPSCCSMNDMVLLRPLHSCSCYSNLSAIGTLFCCVAKITPPWLRALLCVPKKYVYRVLPWLSFDIQGKKNYCFISGCCSTVVLKGVSLKCIPCEHSTTLQPMTTACVAKRANLYCRCNVCWSSGWASTTAQDSS